MNDKDYQRVQKIKEEIKELEKEYCDIFRKERGIRLKQNQNKRVTEDVGWID